MDDLIRRFAETGNALPVEALREAAANWEEAAPPLLALLEHHAAGRDRSEAAASAVFFIVFLAAQMREARAFPALCRLARDPEALEEVLGDGITESFAGILAGTYDGSLETLTGLMEDTGTDEFIRHAAFGAFILLAAEGRIDAATAEATLRGLYGRMLARRDRDSMAWVGWVEAVALLGLERLRPLAQEVFRRGAISRMFMERRHFEQDLREGIAATTPEARRALLDRHDLRPIGNVVALLSAWHAFTEAGRREAEERKRRLDRERLAAALVGEEEIARDFDLSLPAADPYRGAGRNDPCPCGSGKKFKKCCLERIAGGRDRPSA